MKNFIARGQGKAHDFLVRSIDVWVEEGRLTRAEAEDLVASMDTPRVALGLFHLGAHFAISLPLRFPFGALARFFYTLALRLKAELSGLANREKRVEARSLHTMPVMLMALMPGFGRLAYFLSPVMAGERLLLVVPMDNVARKLPSHVYSRLHLEALFLYWARTTSSARAGFWLAPRRLAIAFTSWVDALQRHVPMLAAVVAVDAAAFAIGTYLYVESGRTDTWWFDERNVIATLDVVQLIVAGVAGILAYQAFWRRDRPTTTEEAFGIFLWGIGGIGLLIFAFDDYFTVHEHVGVTLNNLVQDVMPFTTNAPDDILVLLYALTGVTTLYVFRDEVLADRDSSRLLVAAAIAAVVMVLTDAFGGALVIAAMELPAQTLAASLLMCAFVVRYREVNAHATVPTRDLNQAVFS